MNLLAQKLQLLLISLIFPFIIANMSMSLRNVAFDKSYFIHFVVWCIAMLCVIHLSTKCAKRMKSPYVESDIPKYARIFSLLGMLFYLGIFFTSAECNDWHLPVETFAGKYAYIPNVLVVLMEGYVTEDYIKDFIYKVSVLIIYMFITFATFYIRCIYQSKLFNYIESSRHIDID